MKSVLLTKHTHHNGADYCFSLCLFGLASFNKNCSLKILSEGFILAISGPDWGIYDRQRIILKASLLRLRPKDQDGDSSWCFNYFSTEASTTSYNNTTIYNNILYFKRVARNSYRNSYVILFDTNVVITINFPRSQWRFFKAKFH